MHLLEKGQCLSFPIHSVYSVHFLVLPSRSHACVYARGPLRGSHIIHWVYGFDDSGFSHTDLNILFS